MATYGAFIFHIIGKYRYIVIVTIYTFFFFFQSPIMYILVLHVLLISLHIKKKVLDTGICLTKLTWNIKDRFELKFLKNIGDNL